MKSTAEKILDEAEDLFAEKGYDATSLGDVADRVGIRSPSLYNHFRNKEALYVAVIERLLESFTKPMMELTAEQVSRDRILDWLDKLVDAHHANPNFSRLVQHAALSGGERMSVMIERMLKPLFDRPVDEQPSGLFKIGDPELQPWAIMALNNVLMSYITMAPVHRDILGIDPLAPESVEKQKRMILGLAKLVMDE